MSIDFVQLLPCTMNKGVNIVNFHFKPDFYRGFELFRFHIKYPPRVFSNIFHLALMVSAIKAVK